MSAAPTPVHDKLCQVISILQMHYVAIDNPNEGKTAFGPNFMPLPSLELAISMLIETLDAVED